MNNNAWFKKEKPLLSLQSMGGGASGTLMQGEADKTYIDDVFKTYLYNGDGQTQTITNGMDLSSEEGMVWIKCRSANQNHNIFDTVRGVNKVLSTSTQYPYGAEGTMGGGLQQFNSDGWQFGYEGGAFATLNASGAEYSSWTFMKKEGFLDIVTYTGTGSAQNISHSLGSIPGVIIIKGRNNASQWTFWHKDIGGADDYMDLNMPDAKITNSNYFASTLPTSTQFTVGTDAGTNGSGNTYVAYVFAGGESEAATARSVVCDASGDYLSLGSSSDLAMGTGDFTIEGWYKINAKQNFGFFMNGPSGLSSTYGTTVWNYTGSGYGLQFFASGSYQTTDFTPPPGQWFHLALVRNSGTTSLYYNGDLLKAAADTTNYTNTTFQIGGYDSSPYLMDGSVSNFRIVKGTAVYTSSFRVPTEPLTAITNTVLLCCNNSSTTGSTVTPGTITANGDPTASTDNPFDDPSGFKFGPDGDKGIIKTGKYIGNGSSTAVDINIGWEPQWLLIKCSDLSSENWFMVDSMRGIVSGGVEVTLSANTDASEADINAIDLTPTGFKTQTADDKFNGDGHEYIYMAIRRPDGYVGKPPEAGNEVFDIDNPGDGTAPSYESSTLDVVDFATMKNPTATGDWFTPARLIQGSRVKFNSQDAAQSYANTYNFDYMNGWSNYGSAGSFISYMWKRHAGFDVITYDGTGSYHDLPHSMGVKPEMVWVKRRDTGSTPWLVSHKGFNGGTNYMHYYATLDSSNAITDGSGQGNKKFNTSSDHTATHIAIGNDSGWTNASGGNFLCMAFASVEGICKVGSYVGSDSEQTITTGFQPRFVIIKGYDSGFMNWFVLDTTRGWAAGNDEYLALDSDTAQGGSSNFGEPTSTGFTLTGNNFGWNDSGYNYVYYAHA